MLVMTRAIGESAVLGNELLLTVADVEPGRVRLALSERIGPRFGWEPVREYWLRETDEVPLAGHGICRLVHIGPTTRACRLGFTLAPGTTLHRKEVYDALTSPRPVPEE
jgi:sRNA-binding carbon storage regulator CsrA